MRIIFSKTAKKNIEKLQPNTKKLIRNGIQGLTKIPPDGDIKQIKGAKSGMKRLRVGKYRVLFQYLTEKEETYLYIDDVGSRGDIYK
jgi:mRNA interferase RelE/StbE